MRAAKFGLTDEMAELVSRRFRLLGVPVRLKILQSLEVRDRSVNELAADLRISQPNVSRHLKALADGGLLDRRRDGNNIYYSIADPVVFRLCELVCDSTREQARLHLDALERPAQAETTAEKPRERSRRAP
jgi:DNA-binding transcriptional ArsR family regulator